MIKRVLLILLAGVLLFFGVSCSEDQPSTPTPQTASPSGPAEKSPAVYVFENSFDGVLKGKNGYEISNERSTSLEPRTLVFAGQTFQLSPYDREVTRIFDGGYEIGDTGVVKTGRVLRDYETFKYEDDTLTVRAGYTKGGTPVFIEMSGKDVFYLEKSEKQLRDTAALWIEQGFRLNVEGLDYRIDSVLPKETLEGYIEGAETYRIRFSEKTGIFEGRTAFVTFSKDRVVLLVKNYSSRAYEETLKNVDEKALAEMILKGLTGTLPTSVSGLTVVLSDAPSFDVCDGFAFVEFYVTATYVKIGKNKSETVTGIIPYENLKAITG